MESAVRHLIEGELELVGPLHLGSGESTSRPGLEVEGSEEGARRSAEISAVVTDHTGKAYLPGRSLKGALRAWLAGVAGKGAAAAYEQTLGTEEIGPSEERQGRPAFGGKVEIWNAFRIGAPPAGSENLPFWNEHRGTAVRASVALDRRTRTVAGDRLFHEEFVPSGTKFQVKVSGQGLNDDELELLLFGLAGFNAERPIGLGAGGADGHGRFRWRLTRLSRLLPEEIPRWFEQQPPPAGFDRLFPLPAEESARIEKRALARFEAPARGELAVTLAITFDSPFLVAAPHRKKAEQLGQALPDHLPVKDLAGNPLLPASSLRGALRHRAEKILRTLGIEVCRPESPEGACPALTREDAVPGLCAACRLFGAPGWGTLLAVPDFHPAEGVAPERLEIDHVAIDRFTGGVSGSLKFSTEAFGGVVLEGTLRLDLARKIEPWMEGLLALVLRDLLEGDLALGFGAAKGYGECRAEILELRGNGLAWKRGQEIGEALRQVLVERIGTFHGWIREQQPSAFSAAVAKRLAPGAPPPPPKPPSEARDEGLFHNPYHFIPLGKEMDDPESISRQDFEAGRLGALAHDRFQTGEGFYSGRLTYRVTTETPTVIGGRRSDRGPAEPAVVEPFELKDRPALPGATLRGLLSGIAEAATGSAMRVLENRSLSYRAGMSQCLPALGRLVEDAGGKRWLEPLALSPLACDAQGQVRRDLAAPWRECFPQPLLRVYVNGYRGSKSEGVELARGSFLDRRFPKSSSSDNPEEIWYFPLGSLPTWTSGGEINVSNARVKGGRYLLAQDAPPGCKPEPITRAELDELEPAQKALYFPGRLRVLAIRGWEKEIPKQRTHEIFLPLPDPKLAWPRLEVTAALEVFHRLADERTDATSATDPEKREPLPFGLEGKNREKLGALRLKPGDLVFFRLDSKDANKVAEVAEVAVSSIWRKTAGSVFDYVDEELRPFHPKRKKVSAAERLFGFVEQGLDQPGKPALAIASRVRFSFGRLENGSQEPWYLEKRPVPLAILGGPKPPAPALYFRNRHGGDAFIAKSALVPKYHTVQGRKVYLHQPSGERWRFKGRPEDRPKLRCLAKPLRRGLTFLAHLDFDNLSERELALLLYALRPTPAYRHLLGMGKPLGLGRVEISPSGLFLVDRRRRYAEETDLLAAPRYHLRSWAPGYPAEAAAGNTAAGPEVAELVGRFRAAMNPEVRWAIELVGDPESVSAEVIYPRTDQQRLEDEEGFEWFMANEKREKRGQMLAPITYGGGLARLKRRHDPGQGGDGTRSSFPAAERSGKNGGPQAPPPAKKPELGGFRLFGDLDKLRKKD